MSEHLPTPSIGGIHHITAIASSAVENLEFYENVLGLRLVKQTVNFDDPYTYHLYYGDAAGSPGTILTFFPWEELPRGSAGTGMVSAVAFSVPLESIDFWSKRLSGSGGGVKTDMRFGEPVIRFSDPHGLSLELIGVSHAGSDAGWKQGPVPVHHAVFGFHSATAVLGSWERTRTLLTEVLGMEHDGQEGNRSRFRMRRDGVPGSFYDLVVDSGAAPGQTGGGTVHHIAFRTRNDDEQAYWQKTLRNSGLWVTEVRDRKYFRSIYFHEPGGVLFEIATDPPGFSIDEEPAALGGALKLPAEYEPMRSEIEERLPSLRPN